MANKTEDREGKAFIGFILVGIGGGFIASIITENWIFMAPGTLIGLGLGFVAMSFLDKK